MNGFIQRIKAACEGDIGVRFKDVFSIIGPSMIGPSSSHTAGAVRLGRAARGIFGTLPEVAEITLFGSFAATGRGHGTDLAVVGGLLDYRTDDPRIRDSLAHAEESGMKVIFKTSKIPAVHPNTVTISLQGQGRTDRMTGSSIGGGNVEIFEVNGFDVKFSAAYPTLLIFAEDRAGMIADVTRILSDGGINIGSMDVDRKSRNGDALSVIETDDPLTEPVMEKIRAMRGVHRICLFHFREKERMTE